MDNKSPSFLDIDWQLNSLEDDSEYVQTGEPSINEYYSMLIHGPPQPSAWNQWPTKENQIAKPNGKAPVKYKHASIDIMYSQHKLYWSRQTYGLLDYLGDLGGLFEGLYFICGFFIAPISSFGLNSTLLTSIFLVKPHVPPENKDDEKGNK